MTTTTEKTVLADFEECGGLNALVADILETSACVDPVDHYAGEHEEAFIECRLRYHCGCFYWLVGLSDYDQDHRGHWGASSVIADMDEAAARAVAEDLLEQVLESVASVASE